MTADDVVFVALVAGVAIFALALWGAYARAGRIAGRTGDAACGDWAAEHVIDATAPTGRRAGR